MRIFLIILLIESLTFANPQEACYNACGQMMVYMNKNLAGRSTGGLSEQYIKSFDACMLECGKINIKF